MGNDEASLRIALVSRALLHAQLDSDQMQAIAGLRSAVWVTLGNQDASPSMLRHAMKMIPSAAFAYGVWSGPRYAWYWDPSKPPHLIDTVLTMSAKESFKRSILAQLGLHDEATFPHWLKLWEGASASSRKRIARYAPERLRASNKQMILEWIRVRPSQMLETLTTVPVSTVSDEEMRDLLLNMPAVKRPAYMKVWLDGAHPWLTIHSAELLRILDARPGLCKLLSEKDEWLPLIARTSHWDPTYLPRLPIDRVRGDRAAHSYFLPKLMVRAAVLHPNAAGVEHLAAAVDYVNSLAAQKHLSEAAVSAILRTRITSPWTLPTSGVGVGWDPDGCAFKYMMLKRSDGSRKARQFPWGLVNAYQGQPELEKHQKIADLIRPRTQFPGFGYNSSMDGLLEPLAIYVGGQLQARSWESPEMFARTIALLEGSKQPGCA